MTTSQFPASSKAIYANRSSHVLIDDAFRYGLIQMFFISLGLGGEAIFSLLALRSAIHSLLMIPLAYGADRLGKKRIGFTGILLMLVGMGMLVGSGMGPSTNLEGWLIMAISVLSLGETLMFAGWHALLSAIIPADMRGRFFGRLRLIFTIVSLTFTYGVSLILGADTDAFIYSLILMVPFIGVFVQYLTYRRIPEIEDTSPESGQLLRGFKTIFRLPCFIPLILYGSITSISIEYPPTMFPMFEKKILGLGDNTIVVLGNWTLAGMALSFLITGKWVDRKGVIWSYRLSHTLAAVTLGLFYLQFESAQPSFLILILLHSALGFCRAMSGLAHVSSSFAVIPVANKSLAMSLINATAGLGVSVVGYLFSWLIGHSRWGGENNSEPYLLFLLVFIGILLIMPWTLLPKIVPQEEPD